MSKRQSEAYADIQPAIFDKQKKPYSAPRVMTRDEVTKKFAAIHAAINAENHLSALKQ